MSEEKMNDETQRQAQQPEDSAEKETDTSAENAKSEETTEKTAESKKVKSEKKCKDSKKTKELEKKVEELQKELDSTKDMLLRTAAEFDNFKRRETANRDKTANFVKGETMKALLPAIDNIDLAMQADESSPEYAKGVAMTVKGLFNELKKLGLEEINPLNEEFDVKYHQAVMSVEDDSVGKNIVVQVLQKGYKLGDTILRHAMVKVANCG